MLYERKEVKNNREFEKYSGDVCSKCGNKLVLSCVGDNKDRNNIYKIILKDVYDSQKKDENCIQAIMKICGCNAEGAKEKLNGNNEVLCMGDFEKTFFSMEILDDVELDYTVTPQFPFSRYVYSKMFFCPECGNETVEKMEEAIDTKDYIKQGWFCNHCNEWTAYTYVSKLEIDDTIYNLSFSLTKIRKCEKEKLYSLIENISEKKEEKIVINEKAPVIYEILRRLESLKISYDMEPKFPHEILEYKEINDDILNEILSMQD